MTLELYGNYTVVKLILISRICLPFRVAYVILLEFPTMLPQTELLTANAHRLLVAVGSIEQ